LHGLKPALLPIFFPYAIANSFCCKRITLLVFHQRP
jgi:hypothetical protein